jgi:dipeptidase E
LAELAGKKRKALVIANACDGFDPAKRGPRVERELEALAALGFWAEELDLRRHFRPGGDRQGLKAELYSTGLIWARGGNAFVLRRAMAQSGFDHVLTEALRRDDLVFGGYSGGIAVLAPNLKGIELVNDTASAPEGYDPAVIWEGLGILPWSVIPHYKSPHWSSPGIDKVVAYLQEHGLPFRTLTDGEALVIDGEREELAK